MNMGGLKGTATTDITVAASPALPDSVTPQDITLDVPKRFVRNSTGAGTSYLPAPTFSTPRILEHGALIAFTLCVDASHIAAGSYVGQVIVGGPPGVQSATVAVSLNAKNATLFIVGLILASLISLAALVYAAVKAAYGAQPDDQRSWTQAWRSTVKNGFGFWIPTVVAIGAAIGAMLQIYDGNVAWGADEISSVVGLLGSAIAATGVGVFLSSLKGSG
jgi:hypothetical protein